MGFTDMTREELERADKLMPAFYFELLTEVDRRVLELGYEEDFTDQCGIALMIYCIAGVTLDNDSVQPHVARQVMSVAPALIDMLAALGPHVASDHAEFQPLIREALHTPHVLALAEQIQATAKHRGLFDPVADLVRD